MARNPAAGPAQMVLTASVARRYYLDGKSKIEIAEEFALSRFKVARLLETARASGLVKIEIGYPGEVDLELSGRLQERYGLTHSVVVDTPDDDIHSLRQHLGTAAAALLTETVTVDDVIGLGWSRSVSAVAAALTDLAPTPVVQLTGALSRSDGDDGSVDVVRDVARISGGPAYFFHAPFLVADPATARALRRQPEVARTFAQFRAVTKALVGIGRWAPAQSTVYDAANERERKALHRQGIAAEVSGVFVTPDGETPPTALNDRMIGVTAAQLRAIGEVVAVPYETVKAPAVRAALRSRMVSSLVTHTSLARALLLDPDADADAASG
jgi:DNA-binding transcriptional regulator LsrR (DeoR family)